MTVSRPQGALDYYSVLGLSSVKDYRSYTPSEIKAAYRRTLLLHHPDKTTSATSNLIKEGESVLSVDTITAAYKTLITPSLRRDHDCHLLLRKSNPQRNEEFRTGIEEVDLDDLTFDEANGVWFRSCRCGEQRGFIVTESILEEADREGLQEVRVGCSGCSLWLSVGFGVDDSGEEGKEKGQKL